MCATRSCTHCAKHHHTNLFASSASLLPLHCTQAYSTKTVAGSPKQGKFAIMSADVTPFINSAMLGEYAGRTVRVMGQVVKPVSVSTLCQDDWVLTFPSLDLLIGSWRCCHT